MNDELSHIKRIRVLLIVFGVWALLASGRLFYFTVMQRGKYVADSTRLAWRDGTIPVVRGKIETADGVPLAWSEFRVRLTLESIPKNKAAREKLFAYIRKEFGVALTENEKLPYQLVPMAEMSEFGKLHQCAATHYDLRCSIVMMRRRHPDRSLDGVIGFCRRRDDGMLEGVSGLEKEYESVLCGREGIFRVMLNRYGGFVKETLRVRQEALPGKDVKLSQTLADFQKEREKK